MYSTYISDADSTWKSASNLIIHAKDALKYKLKDLTNQVSVKKRSPVLSWNYETKVDEKLVEQTNHQSQVIADDIIGKHSTFTGPYGVRTCLYADTTASGKPLGIIEEFIYEQVLPYYANTHTEISHTSHVTSSYRAEAREIIREAVGAEEDDVVIFYGTGCTGAIHKLIHSLHFNLYAHKPVVLVGPYEHHSNLLPWREAGAVVINVPHDLYGDLDLKALKSILAQYASDPELKNRPLYASFSAASNVTGVVMDDVKVTSLIHEYGGMCFWDYAAAAPHVKIEMNPKVGSKKENQMARKDALFFSGHKFLGGPQTTGILVAKSHVFKNKVPHGAGGGTVFFVTRKRHAYLQERTEIEEGGTPGIVQSIRLGLVFSMHEDIGIHNIINRENHFTRKCLQAWSNVPEIVLLGSVSRPRVPIISFMIEHPESGFFLHHNFVVALLNDLFGIQCRGGCMCAGPYAQTLLGIDLDLARKYEKALSRDINEDRFFGKTHMEPVHLMIFRPGFARLSFPFELSESEVNFIIEALKIIAKDGWKLLPLYHMNAQTGGFKHQSTAEQLPDDFHRLRNFLSFHKFKLSHHEDGESSGTATLPHDFAGLLREATGIINATYQLIENKNLKFAPSVSEQQVKSVSDKLRWFMTPSDAVAYTSGSKAKVKPKCKRLFHVPKLLTDFAAHTYTKHSIPHQLSKRVKP